MKGEKMYSSSNMVQPPIQPIIQEQLSVTFLQPEQSVVLCGLLNLMIWCRRIIFWEDSLERQNPHTQSRHIYNELWLYHPSLTELTDVICITYSKSHYIRRAAGKSLARPGRKQATVTKFGVYSTYSQRSSTHFSACCSNFCKSLKKKFSRLSVQPGLRGFFVDSFRAGPGWSCSKAVYKPVWHIPLASVQWINCWCWTEELSKTCRVSCQNKFVKLVHLVGFIIRKFITMHGHTNIKDGLTLCLHVFIRSLSDWSIGSITQTIQGTGEEMDRHSSATTMGGRKTISLEPLK